MAATRLIPMHKIKNQSMSYTVHEWLDYAMNPDKTRGGELVTAYHAGEKSEKIAPLRGSSSEGRGAIS